MHTRSHSTLERRPRAALLVASAALLLVAARPAAAQDYLYVVSQDDVTVTVVDMADDHVVTTVDLKALGFPETAKPHHVAVEPDGSAWYVSLIASGKILKFDRDNRLVGQADMETPGMLALDPGTDLLYVGRSMAAVNPPQRVGMVHRGSMSIEEIDVFMPRPHALAVDPDGSRIFTASLVENRVAYAPLGEEDVDLSAFDGPMHMPVQFAVSPDGHWLVAGGQMSGDLLVWDVSGPDPVLAKSLDVGGQPWHPVFTPDGRELWIPNQTANTVTVVNTADWSVMNVIRHAAIAEPHGSAISPDGRTVYVSSHNAKEAYTAADGSHPGTVVAIDVASRSVKGVIEVGRYAVGMGTRTPAHRGP